MGKILVNLENNARRGIEIFIIVFLAIITLACSVLGMKRFNFCQPADIQWLKNKPIAHRGLHTTNLDENSIGSFKNAINYGYAIEFDVRCTKDGIPIVFHDDNLLRLTGRQAKLSEMPFSDIRNITLSKSGEKIPTLAEALSVVDGHTPLLIEIKNYGLPGRFEASIIEVLKDYKGEYVIQSYNPFVCNWIKKNSPGTTVGLLLNDIPGLRTDFFRKLKDNLFCAICSPNFIAYNYDLVTKGMLDIYRKSNVIVLGFVLEENDIEKQEYKEKVDNVIFEIQKSDQE